MTCNKYSLIDSISIVLKAEVTYRLIWTMMFGVVIVLMPLDTFVQFFGYLFVQNKTVGTPTDSLVVSGKKPVSIIRTLLVRNHQGSRSVNRATYLYEKELQPCKTEVLFCGHLFSRYHNNKKQEVKPEKNWNSKWSEDLKVLLPRIRSSAWVLWLGIYVAID